MRESFHVLNPLPNLNPRIHVPAQHLGITIQQRSICGLPSKKGSEVGDMAEAKARTRIKLQNEYQLPNVSHIFWQNVNCLSYPLAGCTGLVLTGRSQFRG